MLLGAAPAADAALPFKRCSFDSDLRCARLSVPLDRTGTVPGRVSLFVMKVPARRRGGATKPPVIVLAGGPGQSATDAFGFGPSLIEPAHRDRDLVIYDQRGTGQLRAASLPAARALEPAESGVRGGGLRTAAGAPASLLHEP